MRMWTQSHLCQKSQRADLSVLAAAFTLIFLILGGQPTGQRNTGFRQKIWPPMFRLS